MLQPATKKDNQDVLGCSHIIHLYILSMVFTVLIGYYQLSVHYSMSSMFYAELVVQLIKEYRTLLMN